MFCGNCGGKIADNIKFCKNCGSPVVDKTSEAAPPPAPMRAASAKPAINRLLFVIPVAVVVVVLAGFLLNGSSGGLNERQLVNVIQEHMDNAGQQATVSDVAVERRITEDRTDRVHAVVTRRWDNRGVEERAYLLLDLLYHDTGGWILRNMSSYQNSSFLPLNPPTQEEAISALRWDDRNIWNDYDRVTFVSADTSNYQNGRATFTFKYANDRTFLTSNGTIVLESRFAQDSGSWQTTLRSTPSAATWNFANMLGSWRYENNRPEDATMGFPPRRDNFDNFLINISEISDNSANASGRASMYRWAFFSYSFSEEFNGTFSVSENGQILTITVLSLSYIRPGGALNVEQTRTRTYTITFDADRAFIRLDTNYLNRGQTVERALIRGN